MGRKTVLVFSMIFIFSILVLSVCNTKTEALSADTLVDVDPYAFEVHSIQEFIEEYTKEPLLSQRTDLHYITVLENDNLNFSGYYIDLISYGDDSGELTNTWIVIEFIPVDCTETYHESCENFSVYFMYRRDCGFRNQPHLYHIEEDSKTEDPDLYIYDNEKWEQHCYLLSDGYLARVAVKHEYSNKEKIEEQFLRLCKSIQAQMNGLPDSTPSDKDGYPMLWIIALAVAAVAIAGGTVFVIKGKHN